MDGCRWRFAGWCWSATAANLISLAVWFFTALAARWSACNATHGTAVKGMRIPCNILFWLRQCWQKPQPPPNDCPNRQGDETSSSFGLRRHRPMEAPMTRQGHRCQATEAARMMASLLPPPEARRGRLVPGELPLKPGQSRKWRCRLARYRHSAGCHVIWCIRRRGPSGSTGPNKVFQPSDKARRMFLERITRGQKCDAKMKAESGTEGLGREPWCGMSRC